jgi:hypothetical protein
MSMLKGRPSDDRIGFDPPDSFRNDSEVYFARLVEKRDARVVRVRGI